MGVINTKRQERLAEVKIIEIVTTMISRMLPFLPQLKVENRERLREFGQCLANGKDGRKARDEDQEMPIHDKILEDNMMDRLELLNHLYDLLRFVCLKNRGLQLKTSSYLAELVKNVIVVPSAAECIIEILRDNEDILMNLSKIKTPLAAEVEHVVDLAAVLLGGQEEIQVKSNRETKNFGFEFFDKIFDTIDLYRNYCQSDALRILESMCISNGKSIYLNQKEIFSCIRKVNTFENHIIHTKKSEDMKSLSAVYKNREGYLEEVDLIKLVTDNEFRVQKEYLIAELSLFESLCRNRNGICSDHFKSKYPINLLLHYITNTETPEDFKAIFLRFLLSLYIDSSPRTTISYPYFVRTYSPDTNTITDPHMVSSYDDYIPIDDDAQNEHDLLDSRKEVNMILKLRTELIDYLVRRSNELKIRRNPPSRFFNFYTLEVIKTINSMLRFGCYDMFSTKNQALSNENMGLIEKLMGSLVFAYEYNEEYQTALYSTNIRFLYNNRDRDGGLIPAKKTNHKKGIHNTINSSRM